MRMGKYGHELDLILILTENHSYTAQQIADRLGITRRHLYNYFEYLRFSGFSLIKTGTTYRLDRSTAFFRKLHEQMGVSRDEALYLLRLLADADPSDHYAYALRQKLVRQYNLGDVRKPEVLSTINHNAAVLKQAISQRCMCTLRHYSSPHSHTVSDRIVEPFLFLNGGLDIRCHEISTHQNKTFKLARIGQVELIDVPWIAEKEHKEVFTDLFMFSGEQRLHVRMRMGQLSRNLLVEEYPAAEPLVQADGEGRWLFEADVASYLGIGRFVLGLFSDIEVLGDDAFLQYLRHQVEAMSHIAVTKDT